MLAGAGVSTSVHQRPVSAAGVSTTELCEWVEIHLVTAQLARQPRLSDANVSTDLVIGPNGRKPLRLKIPLFVSDMSFGAILQEAKTALACGVELIGTWIGSGEGDNLA